MTIEENLIRIKQNIDQACLQCGRDPKEIKIIAVTKTRTAEEINQAVSLGLDTIGENRVQELLSKIDDINCSHVHLIGQLQTNKVKYIIDKVELIHSLDRISLAKELNSRAEDKLKKPIDTLVEVNIGHEESKSGVLPENLYEFLDILQEFLYIKVRGLMCVAPANATESELGVYFSQMHEFMKAGQQIYSEFNILSMGMSRDYVQAIKHGSTMIRLGTALFGERDYRGIK